MPEWIADSLSSESMASPMQVAMRLIVAAVFGGCVAIIFRFSHGREKSESLTLIATLVLLSVLIAMVSMVIGGNVARAFSLVGALSIVRFRTVVEDTRDTAFVIFSVIVGMAAGAGLLLIPLLGIPVVGALAILLNHSATLRPVVRHVCSISIRLGLGRDPELTFGDVLRRHFEECHLIAVETVRQGSAIDLSYLARMRSTTTMAALTNELNQVDGVQGVNVKL